MALNPAQDGITHINIYSKGKTELGRLLSNFAHIPFNCEDGHFESIEGYWYWLGTHNEELRKLYGFLAKKVGRRSPQVTRLQEEDFRNKIKAAMKIKIQKNIHIRRKLYQSALPFEHYYVFRDVVRDAGFKWIIAYWEELRTELKKK